MAISTLATLASIVERIRAAAVPGSLFAEHAPDGVLSHVGLALFEMPKRPRRMRAAGYYNALANLSVHEYRVRVHPAVLRDPGSVREDDYAELDRVLFEDDRHTLPTDPVVFHRDYAWGNSIALQNLVFSPLRGIQALGGGAITQVDFGQDLTEITTLADNDQLQVYANIGFANNAAFTANVDELASRWPIEASLGLPSRNLYWWLRLPPSEASYVAFAFLPGVSGSQVSLLRFPQHLPDPTVPGVLELALAHVRQMVRDWGGRIRFVMPGEGSVGVLPTALPNRWVCRVHDITRQCAVCAPTTHYAQRVVDAFFEWLPAQHGHDINRLNARWNSNFGSFTQLRWGVKPGSCRIPAAEEDYYRFLVFLWQEVSQAHYTAAKVQRPGGWYGVLAFGVPGIERSWLGSDAPVSGDWYDAIGNYQKVDPLPGNGLRRVASAALLAGRPAVFAFTSPPHDFRPDPIVMGQELRFRLEREFSEKNIQLLFADVLTAGTVHIGYLRESTWGFADHAPTRARVEAGIRSLVHQLGDTHLRFMSGHARIHVGFEDFELLANPRNVGPTERFGRALLDGLRRQQWPHGLFTDPRVLVREHALATLRRSVVVLPLREDLHFAPSALPGPALLTSLAGLFGSVTQPSTGTVLVVARNSYFVRWLAALVPMGSPPRTRNGNYLHDVQRWRGSRLEILIFDDATFDPVRAAGEVVDYVRTTPSLRADPITPVTVTDGSSSPEPNSAQTSVVTDGVNAFVAVSNLRTQAATTVSLAVDADWQQRSGLGFTIEGQRQFVLQPGETRFVRMVVDPGSVDPADLLRLIGDLAGLLPPLVQQGYPVAHGERAVAIARRLAMAGPAEAPRAVAAIAAICRLLFVKAIRDQMQQRLEVRAVKLWRGQRAVQTAVASGRVQVLAPEHGQLEIASATMTAGLARVPYATQTLPQWDFGQGRFLTVTAAMARETLDVHVHEDGTDAHASVLVP